MLPAGGRAGRLRRMQQQEEGRSGSGEGAPPDGHNPEENRKERVDRELIELLNEIRVALPGVQVLFAFLLTVPFQSGYSKATETQRDMMLVALLAAAVAIVLLVAPTAQHRILFRQHDKERLLFRANQLLLAGTIFLGISVAASLYVVTELFVDTAWAAAATAVISGL